jgi:HD-GYP domain-containing protein (c-di-GMP phosphodiesterase class II)
MIIGTYNIRKEILYKLKQNFFNIEIKEYTTNDVLTFNYADILTLPDVLLICFDDNNIHLLNYLTEIYRNKCMVIATISGEGLDYYAPYKFAYSNDSEMNLSTTAISNMALSMRKEKIKSQSVICNELHFNNEKLNDYINIDMRRYINFIETKDHYTKGHCERTAMYATFLSDKLFLSKPQKKLINDACLIHDVGKIALPIELITKEGYLTKDEYNLIKEHTSFVNQLLPEKEFKAIRIIIGAHHERYDGTGYPNGFYGTQIPLEARVLGIVDSFDAMTTNRGYNTVKSLREARAELIKNSGTQFDPHIVSEFATILDENRDFIEYFYASQAAYGKAKSI